MSLSPGQIMHRLEEIEADLAIRQNELEQVADQWTRAKREKELAWARAYTMAHGEKHVTNRKAAAIEASELIGVDAEARYTALSKVVDVLETRAMIGMGLLKAHGRAGA
jgi:hypothetical protein